MAQRPQAASMVHVFYVVMILFSDKFHMPLRKLVSYVY